MAIEPESPREVGRRLAEARTRAGLSQAQLGATIGVSGPRISHFESGHAYHPVTHRRALADAVHLDAKELFGEAIDEPLRRQRLPRRQIKQPKIQQRPERKTLRRSTRRATEQAMITNQILRLLDRMDINGQRVALTVIRALSRNYSASRQ